MTSPPTRNGDAAAPPLLRVEDVSFSYGRLQVLFEVSLSVRRGEVLALAGTNGAGKSTLLRMVAGLETPSHGTVWFDGQDLSAVPAERRVAAGLVMVPGGRALFPDLSVEDNLAVATMLLRRDPELRRQRVAEVIELFPVLDRRRRQAASSLSGGEQQMLALAKGLVLAPTLLAVDELSLGLAPVIVEQLIEVIDRLRQAGMTVVLVEQSLAVAADVADRAVYLEKGHVRYEGSPADLLESDDIARAVLFGEGVAR